MPVPLPRRSAKGLLVTSGLALGVDGAAHAGALDAGFPTVAVIGNGVDKPYPYRHRTLSERIAGEGVIVSEYPPGTSAKAGHFPAETGLSAVSAVASWWWRRDSKADP